MDKDLQWIADIKIPFKVGDEFISGDWYRFPRDGNCGIIYKVESLLSGDIVRTSFKHQDTTKFKRFRLHKFKKHIESGTLVRYREDMYDSDEYIGDNWPHI